MYPLVGKKAFIKYDLAGFNMNFLSESMLQIDGMFGNEKRAELVEYTVIPIEKNIYMVHWFETISKAFVSQVQNFNNNTVYSNILNLVTSEFFHMTGKIITLPKETVKEPEKKDSSISTVKISLPQEPEKKDSSISTVKISLPQEPEKKDSSISTVKI